MTIKMLRRLTIALLALGLVACDTDSGFVGQDPSITDPTLPVLTTLTVLTDNAQIPSDGNEFAVISALALDANNSVLPGETVVFSSDSGTLSNLQPVTDDNGQATVQLNTGGDPTNRTISVTATSGNLTSTITVDVIGSQLAISGPTSLVQGDTATYTVILNDAGGEGIGAEDITLSSANGNTLSATMVTTNGLGQAEFDVTASVGGTDTLTASGLGLVAMQNVDISDDSFAFTSPAPNTEIDLGVVQPLTLMWEMGGAPVSGQSVNFITTRGTLSSASAITMPDGTASVTVTANSAGPATVSATVPGGPTTQIPLEFVATVADSIELQANPFTVATNEQATLTAIVRDVNNNLVKNKSVSFDLTDVTGGSLSLGSALTDSQGRAQTFYTASSTTSATDGVIVTASVVEGATTISDSVALTVAGRELFVSLGTGNQISEPNEAQYLKRFVAQVTDASGAGVSDVNVQFSILSETYYKGNWVLNMLGEWVQIIRHVCDDEDANRNGVLDVDLGEDFNGNLLLEAGNIAAVSPGSAMTDEFGFILVDILYPQEYARWLEVTLKAVTAVQGTEFSTPRRFVLDINADDVSSADQAPPGVVSPFGNGLAIDGVTPEDCSIPEIFP